MNTISPTKHALSTRLFAVITITSLLLSALPVAFFEAQASAVYNPINLQAEPLDQQAHVNICHTGNGKKFTAVDPDAQSIVVGNSGHGNEHSEDIIPAFYYISGSSTLLFAGQNWNSDTEIIWNSGDCDGGDQPTTGTITIKKVTNIESSQAFDFFLDDSAATTSTLTAGQSSEAIVVSAGPHSIVEGTVESWILTDVSCVNEDQQVVGSQDGAPYYLTLEAGDDVICTFTNTKDEVDQCEDTEETGATAVVESAQGDKKDGSDITDVNRINPDAALGSPDWISGGSTGFFSLGFGGSIVVEFDQYVNDVPGTDLTFHEATNGDSYPTEQAIVEVSQDGDVWFEAGAVSNPTPDRISEIDFSDTGLLWIKYVKVTDTTDPALHSADADAYDLDAIVALKTTCDEPEPTGACEIEGHKYDQNGNPLPNWYIGLMKVISQDENSDIYDLATTTTDKNGYYCIEWDGETRSLRGEEPTVLEEPYSFIYRIYEKLVEGWKFLSIEKGTKEQNEADPSELEVVSEEDTWYGEGEVGTQVGEENGYILADTAYHVDFYNERTGDGDGDNNSDSLSCNITANDTDIHVNDSVTLSWTSVGATSASIADIGSVATSGDLLIEELNEDTTYTMTVLGDYIGDTEEREQATCSILIGTHSGGGGGGGDRLVRDPEGEVLGDSDSANSNESDPQPLVLGEQVSAVPVGGVNTGGGGTASNHNTYGVAAITIISTLMAAFVAFRLRQLHA